MPRKTKQQRIEELERDNAELRNTVRILEKRAADYKGDDGIDLRARLQDLSAKHCTNHEELLQARRRIENMEREHSRKLAAVYRDLELVSRREEYFKGCAFRLAEGMRGTLVLSALMPTSEQLQEQED